LPDNSARSLGSVLHIMSKFHFHGISMAFLSYFFLLMKRNSKQIHICAEIYV
jgi:hypothetical protein